MKLRRGAPGLSGAGIGRFLEDGFVRLEATFPRELADASREIIWREAGCDRADRSTRTTRAGSHLDVAGTLAPAGEAGLRLA